jgi:molybdopterin-guanine dinucleotide biosynthesis protein A
VAAVVPLADGRPQPLAAVYDVRAARTACTRVLDRGDTRLGAVLDDLTVVTVDEPTVAELASPRALANVNAPADLAGFDPADGDAANTPL